MLYNLQHQGFLPQQLDRDVCRDIDFGVIHCQPSRKPTESRSANTRYLLLSFHVCAGTAAREAQDLLWNMSSINAAEHGDLWRAVRAPKWQRGILVL